MTAMVLTQLFTQQWDFSGALMHAQLNLAFNVPMITSAQLKVFVIVCVSFINLFDINPLIDIYFLY